MSGIIKGLTVIDEGYLQQQQDWVKYRLEKLTQIEDKLVEMRQLAEYARNNTLSITEITELNVTVHKLQREVMEMDAHSKTSWLENQ